ncbi:glycosyl hydrolase family 18 protein [Nocardioides sp. YIM B13467]|uniref:glycosyl hydrolase family 18 protein n=1 Tax=Nocardioides sp. YIM B13467 TaxID=3366294 RepID=UPI00366C2020
MHVALPSRRSRRTAGLLIGALAGALALTGTLVLTSTPSSASLKTAAAEPTAINGYRNVGYFVQWGVYGRAFKLKQLETSGVADDLTHLNYAFGNIHHQTLTCFEANKAQGEGPNGSDGAGDAYADYGMSYAADASVSGTADTWDQPLAGSFNQLKQLKAKHPDLKVLLSLGGWTWSKNFSLAAATPESRRKFVSSCIDLYIKGNLPVIDGRGGAGAAAGVFDGFDIDWEWPGSPNGNTGNHVDPVNDRANFKALLAEFRSQLDALGSTTGKDYQLSAFLPANPQDIEAGGWNDPAIFNSLDFGNIQGYDLWGAWDPTLTGHQGNLYADPADPRPDGKRFSVDESVREYLDAGISPAQLGLGMAAYGRGWQGATSSAPWGPATAAAPGTYEAGNEDYDKLKSRGTDHYDAATGAGWRYDGNQWWSYDNKRTIAQKAAYAISKGLGGGMWWELSGDRQGELIGTFADAMRNGTGGPVEEPDPTDPPTEEPTDPPTEEPTDPPGGAAAWSATTVYVAGDRVTYGGHLWEAKWWTQGNTPGTEEWGPWKDLGTA